MFIINKTYNTAAGRLDFKFQYFTVFGTIPEIVDFNILKVHPFKTGYDNESNTEVAIYPNTFTITISDFNGDNYNTFRKLYEVYKLSYPLYHDQVFFIEVKFDQSEEIFRGYIHEIKSEKNSYEIEITFRDGIQILKDFSIANPYILNKLFEKGIIPRFEIADHSGSYAYGFEEIIKVFNPDFTGYLVGRIEAGDKDSNLKKTIEELFKLLDPGIVLEFQNEFGFVDILTGSPEVLIDAVDIRRILSNLFGRFIVINKFAGVDPVIVMLSNADYEYNRPEYFKSIFEDNQYKVFYHDWDGTLSSGLRFEKGIQERSISEILKKIAKNLFSYFGYKEYKKMFFRHRRFLSNPVLLTSRQIVKMEKILTVDKIQGVKIDDQYTGNYGTDGQFYDTDNIPQINYSIPLNAVRTDNSFEYRMTYNNGQYRVIYFHDLQTGFRDLPMEVISRAEWEAYKVFRDKYTIELIGVNYIFDQTFKVNYENYKGSFRLITLEKDYENNKTIITGLELN